MMESSEEAGDDQGSGWLLVKKKHRSSSKVSLQSWVGGIKGKHRAESSPSPLYDKSTISKGKHGSSYVHSGSEIAENFPKNATNFKPVLVENEADAHFQDKCVVNQGHLCLKPNILGIVSPPHSNIKIKDGIEVPQIIPQIKWGDLDDDSLLPQCGKTVATKSQLSDGNYNIDCRKCENVVAGASGNSSSSVLLDQKLAETSSDVDIHPSQAATITCKDELFENNCKELKELSSKNVEVSNIDDRINDLGVDPSHCVSRLENLDTHTDKSPNFNCTSGGNACTHAPPEVSDFKILESPVHDGTLNRVLLGQESELLLQMKSGPVMTEASTVTNTAEGSVSLQDAMVDDGCSRTEILTTIREGSAGESKERFRERLWCFLFENLNRAVDELYLLCELECDLEQMKEAVLVLEEAASDFKELNSRVKEFDNTKSSSSQVDDLQMIMKSDNRRPHALSWEVRRMTTSPHRAEILSSSLEAFKKIQQERASMYMAKDGAIHGDIVKKSTQISEIVPNSKDLKNKSKKQGEGCDIMIGSVSGDKRNSESRKSCKLMQIADSSSTRAGFKGNTAVSFTGKNNEERNGFTPEIGKLWQKKSGTTGINDKSCKYPDHFKRQNLALEKDLKDKEIRSVTLRKSMDAWKEKRNWEDILTSPFRGSSRVSYSPGMGRRSAERAQILHDKLMSPEKKKKTASDMKKEAEEKHARALKIRNELENERVQKLQRTSEKLTRVNEWQAVRSMKLRECMHARHQRSESRHEAFLAQVVRRAGDESSKVNEVRFITSLNEENKKLMLRQKLHDSEMRRAEKLQVIKTKQKEDMAREEAVLERRKLLEAEKLQRLAEVQRKKEEAQTRREEERKASSAAREAKAIEQVRRKQARAKAQQEEAEVLALKLAERLSESEQRRKFYLEQIRERASMDFRDQSSPLLRYSLIKENQGRSTLTNNSEDNQESNSLCLGDSALASGSTGMQHQLKRRIKKIRQRLMALKHDCLEPLPGAENGGIGYRTALKTARAKFGRWLQELQKLRQARREGAASIGLITAEMVKFAEGKEPELHASRQAGLLDFIASALPASHTSKPDSCQVTVYLLRLLRVVLSLTANRSYFLSQNLLPPIIPMLSAALENYIKIAASLNTPGSSNLLPTKTLENFESISEVLDGFLWIVTTTIGHVSSDERQLHMQDGLLELVVVYQVIHRLRDLFALYDRPQVEGSPFPSSILLGIKLLMVLTSRRGTVSSIDWESFQSKTETVTTTEEIISGKSTEYGNFSESNNGGHSKTPVSGQDCATSALPDVPEDSSFNESCKRDRIDETCLIDKGVEKSTNVASKSDNDNAGMMDNSDNVSKKLVEDTARSLEGRKDEKALMNVDASTRDENLILKHSTALLLSVISETGIVCVLSLLTAVLLQANTKLSSEQGSYVLPSNFEEVATGVLKVLNNLALMDIILVQRMLARPDLKMEFFHLMSFLLSHCNSKWTSAADQVGLLLLESLSLLGYFALFHPRNQAVLRWGNSPTILHKVCDLPFAFFSDPELMPILAGTLVASSYGCEQNKQVVEQEISTDMLLSLLRSCRTVSSGVETHQATENLSPEDTGECNILGHEFRKPQADISQKSNRCTLRSNRVAVSKGALPGNFGKLGKTRNQRDIKGTRTYEELVLRDSPPETSSLLMLHCRFPLSFIDKAEQFFSAGSASITGL